MNERLPKYLVAGVDLSTLRNNFEELVAQGLRTSLEARDAPKLDRKAVQDAYAYALNRLPPHYPQRGAAIPADLATTLNIGDVVKNAIRHVNFNPKP